MYVLYDNKKKHVLVSTPNVTERERDKWIERERERENEGEREREHVRLHQSKDV